MFVMAERFKIMRAWDRGLNKIAYIYRNPETGKKVIGETKFAWWFYVLTEDYHRLKTHFNRFINNNVINSIEEEGKYTRIYADYPHKTESLDKDMERDWSYKTFAFNDMLEKLNMVECRTFEADILPHKRFALQDNVEFEQDYKVLFLDIETDDRIRVGQPIPGEYRILSVALKDGETGKEAYLVIKEDTDEEEKAMLTKLAKLFNTYDVLISWNGNAFDIPYIKSRMIRYGIQLDWRKLFPQDQMKIFQKSVSLRSYSLENVSQEYLGEGKIEHEGIGIYEMWKNHPELLEKYNRVDVRRCFQLEQKTKYLAVARNVNAIGRCPCDDLFITRKIDNLVVKQAQEDKHYHFDSIIREYDEDGCLIVDEEDDDKFEGAYVFPPKPGRYKNTKVFDYSSLYPNVIKTLNISPDTLVEDDSVPDEMCIKTPSGHRFRKDFVGILPKVITMMKEKRDYYKDLMSKETPGSLMHKTYDNLQYVYKSFGLSFYGALGETHTRFYDVRVAESVTLGGQYFNKAGAKFLEEQGYIILYGDSVTKDRCTIIKTNNDVSVISFEELFNKTTKRYIKGGKEYGSFDENVTTLSYNFQTHDSEWKPIDCVVRHKVKKEVYHYRYRHGVTEVSKDHSLINSEGQCFKPTDSFDAFSLSKLPDIKPITTIDLLNYMEPYSYGRKRGGNVYLTADDEKIFLSHNRVKKTTMLRYIDVNDPMFSGFLSLIAHYICNGSSSTPETTQSRKGASIASRDFWLLNQLKQTTDWLFKNAENGILCQNDGNNKLQMMTCLQAIVFKQLCGQKYDKKRIPDFVYRLSLEQKKHFIQQLMLGDGSITEIKSGTNYDFESASIKLISGLSTLMKQVGMNVVCQSNFNKKTYTVKNLINEEYGKHLIENICKPIEYDDYLYDLSVSDNNNFVDAMGSILLHNTDSLFVDKIKSDDEVIDLLENIKVLCEKIAKDEFNADICTLEMSYDKGFKTFLIVNAKKRYAGYLDYLDGHEVNPCKLKITGFEYVRTDQCGFVKKYQKEILEWILADEQPTAMQIRSWVLDKQSKVFSGKLPTDELMFAQKVTKPIDQYDKPLMHVKVATQLLKDGKDFWVGDKVQYFIESLDTRQKPLPKPLYSFKGKYNESYYWNNKIFPAFERILSVIYPNINWSEYYIKGGRGGSTKAGRSFLWS